MTVCVIEIGACIVGVSAVRCKKRGWGGMVSTPSLRVLCDDEIDERRVGRPDTKLFANDDPGKPMHTPHSCDHVCGGSGAAHSSRGGLA